MASVAAKVMGEENTMPAETKNAVDSEIDILVMAVSEGVAFDKNEM
jgi:hypothetical protein